MPEFDESNPVLYKYRSLDINTLEMLRSGQVWFSGRKQLNDPFDCMPSIDMSMDDASIRKLFQMSGRTLSEGSSIEEMRSDLIEHLENLLDLSGVFCVTSANDNELMWAHYGNNHEGIAIGYKPREELFKDRELFRHLPGIVKYQGRGEISGEDFLSRKEKRDTKGTTQRAVDAMFFSKNSAWEYEKEYRFTWPTGSGLRTLEAELTSVVYGMRFDRNKCDLIRTFLPPGVQELTTKMNGSQLIVQPVDF